MVDLNIMNMVMTFILNYFMDRLRPTLGLYHQSLCMVIMYVSEGRIYFILT